MKSKHIFLVITLIIISSCTNYEERHYEWIKENKGKIFTKDMENELSDILGKPVTDSGEPLDNYVKFDLYYQSYEDRLKLFDGPFYTLDESKKIKDQFEKEIAPIQDKISKRRKKEMSSPILDKLYEQKGNIEIKYMNKYYENLEKKGFEFKEIDESGRDEPTREYNITLRKFIEEYNSKYPDKSFDESRTDVFSLMNQKWNSQFERIFSFTMNNKKYSEEYTPDKVQRRDFSLDITRDVKILADGTVSGDSYIGGACITSRDEEKLKKDIIGDWVFKQSGEIRGAILIREDGYFSQSNSLSSREGYWFTDCLGKIYLTTTRTMMGNRTSQTSLILTNYGLQAGSTPYTKS